MANSFLTRSAIGWPVYPDKKQHIYFERGQWILTHGGRFFGMPFKSIRHMQDYCRTGRL